MKKFIVKSLCIALMAIGNVCNIFAQTPPNDEIWYTSTDGKVVTPYSTDGFGASIVSNTYSSGKGIIKFDGNVISIRKQAFWNCSRLSSITIPNSVKSIDEQPFRNTSITSITIPNSVTSIQPQAFIYLPNLTSIKVEAKNSVYDSRDNCNAIIRKSDNTLISGCKSTIIPNSVTSIGYEAFCGCSSLTSITIPNSVTSIGSCAFNNCSKLTSFTIPNSVTSIGDDAFSGCSRLPIINNLRYADTYLVEAVDKTLSTYNIKEGTKWIGGYAFYNCSSLISITIPNSVTSIGYGAFQYCSSLASITIPNSVTSIGREIFYGCSSLPIIDNLRYADTDLVEVMDKTLSTYNIKEGTKWIGDGAFINCSNLTSITIPNSVTSIGYAAFHNCSSLASITIPNSVTSIGEGAFYGCSKLTSIIIPNLVTSIGNVAFYGCTSLASITNLATTPQTINSICFSNYSATLHVNEGYKNIYEADAVWGKFTVVDDYIRVTSVALNKTTASMMVDDSLTLKATVLPENATQKTCTWTSSNDEVATVDKNGVVTAKSCGTAKITAISRDGSDISASCEVRVTETPPNNEIWYTSTDGKVVTPFSSNVFGATIISNTYSNGKGIIKFNGNVASIGTLAFKWCSSLTSITIPNSVTSIESEAFCECSSLSSVHFSTSLTKIGDFAFEFCNNLSAISLPISLKYIGMFAFDHCPSLTSVFIPKFVETIQYGAFSCCENLNSIEVDYWNSVYGGLSDDCNAIINHNTGELINGCKNTKIPNGVKVIRENAFDGCKGLKEITLPNSLTKIEGWAFRNCTGLDSIAIPDAVTSLGGSAFYGCSSLAFVTNLATTPQKIDVYTFSKYGTLHVYESLIDLYKADTVWGKFTVVDDIPTQKATSITLDSTTYHCEVNGTVSLLAKVSSVATIQNVSWATADSTILSIIDANKGQFKGLKIGKTTITATTIDGSKLSTKATVFVGNYIPVTSVALNKTTASMMVDDSLTLKATVLPENATQKTCTWTSSNDEVATVDKNGKVMAKSVGTATITATAKDNTSLSATCTITVNERPAADTDYSKMNNAIYIEKKEARVGSQYDLSINLKNEATFGGFQFDLYLPDGITVDLDEYEEPVFEKSSRINAKATLEAATQIDGSTRFLCYSTKNYAITDTDGEILTVTLNISDELGDGDYPIYMKNIILSTTTSSKVMTQDMKSTISLYTYTLGDANDDKSIDVVDISCIASYILGNKPEPFIAKAADFNEDESIDVVDISSLASYILNGPAMSFVPRAGLRAETETPANLQIIPFAIQPGETLDIDVELNNPDYPISATQYDIYLPKGLSFALDEYEEPIISGSRGSKITTEGAIQNDGALRMLSYSSKNYVYTGTEGAIATVTIKADENMKAGVYALQLRNMFLTKYVNKVATKVVPVDYDGSVVVGTPAEKNITLVGNLTSDALDMVNTVWGESTTVASFDMTQAIDVDAETEIVTGNANTLYYIGAGKALANESNVVVDGSCTQLTLTDGYNYNAPVAFEATNAQYTRNFTNHNWQALYLPYEVAVSAISGNFEVAEMTAASTGDAVVIEKLTSGTLAANKPYFIRLKSDKTAQNYTFSATNQDIAVTAANPQTYGDFTLTGIYEAMNGTQMQANNAFGLSEGKFCKALDASAKLNAFRFYLTGASSDVKIVVDGETGINDVDVDADVDTIYNLAGQKLVKAQKGVNIMNGKKVIF